MSVGTSQRAQKRRLLDEGTEDNLSLRLNERARKDDSEVPIGKPFFSIPKTNQRSVRHRKIDDYLKTDTITDFLTSIHNTIQTTLKALSIKFPK